MDISGKSTVYTDKYEVYNKFFSKFYEKNCSHIAILSDLTELYYLRKYKMKDLARIYENNGLIDAIIETTEGKELHDEANAYFPYNTLNVTLERISTK